MGLLQKILGDANEKYLKTLQPVVEKINDLEKQLVALADEELRAKTTEFKNRLQTGETMDSILPEVFAVVREASRRTVGLRHFDVQLIGGIVLHKGQIAEMKTGEGKTLVATLSLYLNALAGRGAHLITVNDYLARVGAVWMGPVYNFLGMSVGVIQPFESFVFDPEYKAAPPVAEEAVQSELEVKSPVVRIDKDYLRSVSRKDAYACDITYGTNNEFGFDYLRDNMVVETAQKTQRELFYAIVDEVDSILIDEARTPLIISAPAEESAQMYYQFARIVKRL